MTGTCDLPEFYAWSEPIARKRHRCCECSAPIERGEKHFHGRGKWDTKMESFRQHLACMAACMVIRDEFGGDCGFGSLKEEFDDIRCDNWYPERDRYKPAWRRLRALMAKILWRERRCQQQHSTSS